MTKPIRDKDLYAAIDGAFALWQAQYEAELPAHTFSPAFEEKAAAIPDLHRPARRTPPLRTAVAAAAIAATLTLTVGALAAESDWIGKAFHNTLPPADGPDFTISEAKDIEPVSEAHLALHELPYASELRDVVGGIDLYIGDAHPVDGHYGCAKHGDESHFVSISEKLTVMRRTCAVCGYKEIDCGIETIETCLTEPSLEEYAFCDHHEHFEGVAKAAADFEGWTAVAEAEYTEWEEDRSLNAKRLSPCAEHNHFAHDQVTQIRYAVTEYKCPDCPKIVPCAELQRRTVCYTLTEGLTYAAEPTY